MKNLLGMLGIAAGVALAGNASAQDAAADGSVADAPAPFGSPLYISPQFTYTIADKERRGKNGYGGTLAVGSRLVPFAAVELAANYTNFKNDASFGGSSKFTGVGANVLLFPFAKTIPNLYGLLGGQYSRSREQPVPVGAGAVSKRNFNSGDFLGGVGYWLPFTAFGMTAALRLYADYRLDLHHRYDTTPGSSHRSTFDDFLLSAGLVIPLFAPETKPAPPPPAETPTVVPVAEAPPPPAEEPPPPPPAPPCRAPIAGEKVDLSGCASGDVIVLRGVNFDFNKATLTANAKTILDQVADALKAAADIKVEIGGHTDGKGGTAYNQKLSEKRAESVKAYLVEHGIDAGRMTTKGYGKEHPIADNKTDEGRELNRRVELKILG
jgi:OOP family OmpA-OmpF porin